MPKSSPEKVVRARKEGPYVVVATQDRLHKLSPPEPPSWLVMCLHAASQFSRSSHRDYVQANILDRGPDNGQATGLRREDVDLLGALPHIAEKTLS